MTHVPYPYKRIESWRYTFVSIGNKEIEKVVDFVVIGGKLTNFTSQYPLAQVIFRGSTPERTRLYARILRTYHITYMKEFEIAVVLKADKRAQVLPYDPKQQQNVFAFLIKRIQ